MKSVFKFMSKKKNNKINFDKAEMMKFKLKSKLLR